MLGAYVFQNERGNYYGKIKSKKTAKKIERFKKET